jgi:hypothetical protein
MLSVFPSTLRVNMIRLSKIFRRYAVHFGLGWVYTARGQYPEAITELLAEENVNGRSDNVLEVWAKRMRGRAKGRKRKIC